MDAGARGGVLVPEPRYRLEMRGEMTPAWGPFGHWFTDDLDEAKDQAQGLLQAFGRGFRVIDGQTNEIVYTVEHPTH